MILDELKAINVNYRKLINLRYFYIMSMMVSLTDCDSIRAEETQFSASGNLSIIEPKESYEDYNDKAEWWSELMVELSAEFGRICDRSDADESLKQIIEMIGNKDLSGIAKLKLCLSAPDVFLAQGYQGPLSDVPNEIHEDIKKRYRSIKLQTCKLQSEAFINNRELLDSYYRALVWSRQFFGPPHDHHVRLGLQAGYLKKGLKSTNNDYWWYARSFILLVHATGQNHLLIEVKPSELEDAYLKWSAWLLENYDSLQGHPTEPIWIVGMLPHTMEKKSQELNEPSVPFSNWDKRMLPPSPRLINHMKDFIGLDWIK